MGVLGAVRYYGMTRQRPELSNYGAHIVLPGDTRMQGAVLAANLNMLRREAPHAYLFARGYSLEAWQAEDIGEDEYKNTRDAIEVGRGLWLGYPDHDSDVVTTVTAIGEGDVTPFAHLLDQDDFALLCLPRRWSLVEVRLAASAATSNREAHLALLAEGGCTITAVDVFNLHVWTSDTSFARYFTEEG